MFAILRFDTHVAKKSGIRADEHASCCRFTAESIPDPTVTTVNSVATDDPFMTLDDLPTLEPEDGEVLSDEVAVTDDVLVKVFALGPGAELDAHGHADSTNVFHVLGGTVTVIQGDEEEAVDAPGVVVHERGVVHGARNDTDETVVFTASLAPMPS